jgi:uncharacterized protein GlcG (DUF336 family)
MATFLRCAGTLILACGALVCQPGLTRIPPGLDAASALRMVQTAAAACEAEGYPVVVVVTSTDGTTRMQYTSDDTHFIDIESARRKAATAARTGRSTAALAEIARSNNAFATTLASLSPDSLLIGGGLPVLKDGRLAGVIGVGGAPRPELDEACARTGVAHGTGFTSGP